MTTRGWNRCDYVLQEAGKTPDGNRIPLDGHGDATRLCRRWGKAVPRIHHLQRSGPGDLRPETIEGTIIRCPEHIDR